MPSREAPADAADADLVARAAAGDREAFAGLYSRHQAAMYRFAFQMSGSAAAAEDIVHDVFVALMRNLARFDATRPLSPYLYGIARNVTRRRLRRERRLIALDESVGYAQRTGRDELSEQLEQRDHLRLLRQAIVALSPKHREVIVLCDLHKLSYERAAASIGCALGTVRSRLHRARALLAKQMKRARAPVERLSRTVGCAV